MDPLPRLSGGVLASLLCLSLAACAGQSEDAPITNPSARATPAAPGSPDRSGSTYYPSVPATTSTLSAPSTFISPSYGPRNPRETIPGSPANLPPSAHVRSEPAAISFVRSYVAALNTAIRNPEQTRLIGYGSERCGRCYSLGAKIGIMEQNGWRGKSDFLQLSDLQVTDAGAGDLYVQGPGREPRLDVVDERGQLALSSREAHRQYRFKLRWRNERWVIDEMLINPPY